MLARKHAVVHRQDNYVFEVETAGFEHTHDLKPLERLTLKRHGVLASQLVDEIEQCGQRLGGEVVGCQRLL